MRRTAAAILALAALSDASSARAEFPKFEIPRLGIFRKKKEDPPAPPKQQSMPVQPEAKPANPALATLRTDRDEKDRAAAALALRTADIRNDLDVLPTLMSSLQQDPSATVRATVAETIGKLKPVSAVAGATLEAVVMGDPSDAVRKAAQAALWQYHLNGYRSSASNAAVPQTVEPPLAKPRTIAPAPSVPAVLTSTVRSMPAAAPAPAPAPSARPISTGIGRGAIYPQTIEPPLAKPKVKPPVPTLDVPKLREEPSPVPEKKDANPVKAIAEVIPAPAVARAIPVVPPPPAVLTIPPPGK